MQEVTPTRSLTRRQAALALAGLGVGSVVFQRALAAQAESKDVSSEMIQQAEWIAGIELDDEDRARVASRLRRARRGLKALRSVELENGAPPATVFSPIAKPPVRQRTRRAPKKHFEPKWTLPEVTKPDSDVDLAYLSVAEQASLLHSRQISSVELTKLSLERLKAHDPKLLCVVNLTERTALEQAERADQEIAAGRYRGPLHGIPWGAKDLVAYPGYPTTWGAPQYKDRVIDQKATVARKLEEAGAILVAKLSLGALAMGDRWFRGMTRNPWDPEQGSSGSSAGSASAVAAGLVSFAIGSETYGSIVSPCTRCGTTGLRPTFGRVSRTGCMTLSWSLDKVGPIARSVEDCSLIFSAIHGPDPEDPATVVRPFDPRSNSLSELRVGYFEGDDAESIGVLKKLGVQLVPIQLPKAPIGGLLRILDVEAAAAFESLTRSGDDQGIGVWPDYFRAGHLTSAVDYVRAQRVRRQLMTAMERATESVDVWVDTRRRDLAITNLTGHPSVVLPRGFRKDGDVARPLSIVFSGQLHGDADVLAIADAYQRRTGHHKKRPPQFS
ncbi:MAG: amidase [Planctomycetota bacterium]